MIRIPTRALSRDETEMVLHRKRDWILEICSTASAMPRRVIAFGSAVSGRFREDSDIDLALIFTDEGMLRHAKMAITSAKREDLWPLDILYYTEKDFRMRATRGGVCSIIQDEGRVLFDDREDVL